MKTQNNWKPVIESLFSALANAEITVDEVDNGGDETTTDPAEFLDEATACDECRVLVRIPGETRRHTLLIVLGNEPFETVSDYSQHPLLDATLEAWSESWEGKPCPTIEA
jgi:hypothetical protein